MVTRTAVIRNSAGIHVRPSGIIIAEAGKHNGAIRVSAKGMETDLTDHMGLLALGLCKGDSVDIFVNGNNEEEVCRCLVDLFQREFDFPPGNA